MDRTLIHRLLALTCVTMLLLSGCHIGEEAPGITESQEWEVPQLNYGVLEYEKLEVLPWYSGRMEATSFNRMAETELGYYQTFFQNLFHYRLLQDRDYRTLCYTVDPCCSSSLYIIVCTC